MTLLLWWFAGMLNILGYLWSDIKRRGLSVGEFIAIIITALIGPFSAILWLFHPTIQDWFDIKIFKGKNDD